MKYTSILTSLVLGSTAVLAYPQASDEQAFEERKRAATLQSEAVAFDAAREAVIAAHERDIQLARAGAPEAPERPELPEQPELPEAPEAPEPPEPADTFLWSGRSSPGRLLVVRTETTSPEAQVQMEEDMAVMLRILDKTIDRSVDGEEGGGRAMGIPVVGAAGSGGIRGLFLEGNGPVFLLAVRFPLLPPAEPTPESKPKTKTETEWENARREVANPDPGWATTFDHNLRTVLAPESGRPYDSRRVDRLKSGLLEALKNGTHIRNLKSEETVTISVFGTRAASGTIVRSRPTAGRGSGVRAEERLATVSPGPRARTGPRGHSSKGSVLTIRARKSDIDAYANGKLDDSEFARKASVAIYPGESPAMAGGFSLTF